MPSQCLLDPASICRWWFFRVHLLLFRDRISPVIQEQNPRELRWNMSFLFFLLLFLNYRWEGARLAKYGENLKEQKSARHIDFWFLTSAVQSPDVKPPGRGKEILWPRLLSAVIQFYRCKIIALARDLSSTFDIAEVRSRHWPSFEDKALESHSLYVYFSPALFISCDRLYGRDVEEESYLAEYPIHASFLVQRLQI